VLLASLLALAAAALMAPAPLSAQEQVRKPWSLRDMLFPSRKSPRLETQPVPARPKARTKSVKKRKSTSKPAEPRLIVVEKQPDAKVVLVIGDFVAAATAEGLDAVFADNPRVRIVDRSSGSSGFVRPDHFDWPGGIAELVAKEKAAAVVFVVGANDRQQMRIDGVREPKRSDAWLAEYTRRTSAFAKAATSTRVPLVWMGAPAFKSPKMNSDMLALNEIFRTAATDVRAEFIDVWDGFVDENGAFVTTGPDINGQPVRLRSGDGINFTRAGKRKLAFFTEKPLRKLLGESGVVDPASLPSAASPDPAAGKVDPALIERTAPVSLSDPALDGGDELMGAAVTPKSSAASPGERLLVEGMAPDAAPGRADDFAWPPRAVVPSTALVPATETTTAIKN